MPDGFLVFTLLYGACIVLFGGYTERRPSCLWLLFGMVLIFASAVLLMQ